MAGFKVVRFDLHHGMECEMRAVLDEENFRRDRAASEARKLMSSEYRTLLDKVSSQEMLADSPRVSALERERDYLQYQLTLLHVMVRKSYANTVMEMDREVFERRIHDYEMQLGKINAAMKREGQAKWGRGDGHRIQRRQTEGQSEMTLDPQSTEWQVSNCREDTIEAAGAHIVAGGCVMLSLPGGDSMWGYFDGEVPDEPHVVFFVPFVPKAEEDPEVLRKNLHDMLDMAIERSAAGDYDEAVRLLDGLANKLWSPER